MRAFKLFLLLMGIVIVITLGMAIIKYTPAPYGPSNQRDAETSTENVRAEPKLINQLDDKKIQAELKDIATKFVAAEYQGDTDTLLAVTAEDANDAVRAGELLGFSESHKFDRIVYYNFIETEKPDYYVVVVAVSTSIPAEDIDSTYYENLTIKKINNNWLITKIERDA